MWPTGCAAEVVTSPKTTFAAVTRGMRNFVEVYRPLLDSWILFENTGESPIIIGLEEGSGPEIRDAVRYARFLDGSKSDE